jgi:enoyl-CoA hydratase/carnithine racemase
MDPFAPTWSGLVTESLAYSTLQSGREFRDWLAQRGPASVPPTPDPVLVERQGNSLHIALNRPARHNAFSTDMRQALLDALTVAIFDESIDEVVLTGNGPSLCSGGDLDEFGSFDDPAAAHFARTRYSPARALDDIASRLGERLIARVHGQVVGSGLEMAAFCGRVEAHRDSRLGLPELALGLIPGAGGTVSITRRIGRWRTAFMVLSGRTITASTALSWGLVDALV